MARTGGVVNYNTFVKGLITEASPLTFPENATMREENFDLRRDGTRARRLGMEYEASYVQNSSTNKDTVNSSSIVSHEWFNAGNSQNENFLVVQVANILSIYSLDSAPISGKKRELEVDLNDFKVNKGTSDESSVISPSKFAIAVSALKGKLLIVSPAVEPFYISYDTVTGTFQVSKITVQSRDLYGIEDNTTSLDERPTAAVINPEHEYNLKNQGWSSDNITLTYTDLSFYPSNADLWHTAKQTSFDTTAGTLISDLGNYSPALLIKEGFGNTPAPRGKFIYNVFRRDYRTFSSTDSTSGFTITALSLASDNKTLYVTVSGSSGLLEGDEVKLSNIGVSVKFTERYHTESGSIRYNVIKTVALTPDQNTLSGSVFTVDSIVSSNKFTVKWPIDLGPERISGASKTLSSFDLTSAKAIVSSSILSGGGRELVEAYRFKAVSGYAGRAWYAGMDGGAFGSHIFFSQILDDDKKIGLCYQEADPTSEHISDLVDTDGGFIIIPEARNVQALVPMGQFLFVFSTNGVWRIFGNDGGNFSATGYSIEKVSDVGVNSRFSIVPVENEIYYWATGGIYKVVQAEVSGNYSSTNISQLSIQTLFFDIGSTVHRFIKGTYDSADKKILWMYDRSPDDVSTNYKYNSILTFDLILQAFYKTLMPLSVNDDKPFLCGSFQLPVVNLLQDPRNVVAGGNNIVAGASNVISTLSFPRDQVTQTKFLTASAFGTDYKFTFSEYNQVEFLDFKRYDGVGTDAAAFLITGSDTQGSQANKKQVHYLLMYFKRTEIVLSVDANGNVVSDNPSSCLVNILWDWATDINSIRAGSQFQAYRPSRYYIPIAPTDPYTYGEDTVVSKSKLRGRGRAFSLAIQSEPGKDLHVYGWSLLASGGTRI